MTIKGQDPFKVDFVNPDGEKLIGGYFPRSLADYISVLALYEGSSVSSVLRRMIDEYIQYREEETYMIRVLANRAYKEWRRRWEENKHKETWQNRAGDKFEEYLKELQGRLIKRGLTKEKADEVTEQIKLLYNPNQLM